MNDFQAGWIIGGTYGGHADSGRFVRTDEPFNIRQFLFRQFSYGAQV
ncbi:hypothetical protein RSC2_00120 [Bacillus paralicheniformis]|nr:hypothetical protein RSC2_00120 [Bacillus paralicheniformis]